MNLASTAESGHFHCLCSGVCDLIGATRHIGLSVKFVCALLHLHGMGRGFVQTTGICEYKLENWDHAGVVI